MNRRDRRRAESENRKFGNAERDKFRGPHEAGTQPLARKWDAFLTAIMPPEAPDVQRQEMRRAFYSGAQAVYALLMQETTSASEVEEPDVTLLANLDAELEQFGLDIKSGKA